MSVAALGAALAFGLVAGRLAGVVAARYTPPRRIVRRRFPLMELSMAIALMAVVARFGLGWNTLPPSVLAVAAVTLSAVDLRAYRLPDAISLPASGASLAAIAVASVATGRSGAIVSAVATGLGLTALLWVAHEVRPGGLGFGDVKFAMLLGLHLGWAAATFHRGWWAAAGLAAHAVLLSSLIGLAMGLVLALLRWRGFDALPDPARTAASHPGNRLLDTTFPFGPALAAGTMLAVSLSAVLVG